VNASGSQRSSIKTSSSTFSRHSHLSTDSYTGSGQVAQYANYRAQPAETDYIGNVTNSLPQPSQDLHDSPYTNQASPYPHSAQLPPEKHYCLTCKKCYSDVSGLKKHRKEHCESAQYWLCLPCLLSPTKQWLSFSRVHKLRDHHREKHGDRGEIDMEAATKKFPTQQAWGCPCCRACFSNRTEWHNHEKKHVEAIQWGGKNGDAIVNGWSWETLFQSLLFDSSCLKDAVNSYGWRNCKRRLGVNTCKELQFVLERYALPPEVARHHDDSPMRIAEDFVSYAHQILSTASCDFQHLPSSIALNWAISPVLSNFPCAREGASEQDVRIPTPYFAHCSPRSNQHNVDHQQVPTQQGGPWPSATDNNPLYNNGLQHNRIRVSAYANVISDAPTEHSLPQSSHESKRVKGKFSLRNLRANHTASKGQPVPVPEPIFSLAAYQAAASLHALTPQNIFGTQSYSQDMLQDGSTELPTPIQGSGDPFIWFDPTDDPQYGQYR
jgi:hypothetical protein